MPVFKILTEVELEQATLFIGPSENENGVSLFKINSSSHFHWYVVCNYKNTPKIFLTH